MLISKFNFYYFSGVHLAPNCYPQAIEMVGSLPIDQIVTHELSLDQVIEGIDMVNGKHPDRQSIKVVLNPWTTNA